MRCVGNIPIRGALDVRLFFYRIHWGNYLYAYVQSWRGTVHFVEAAVPRPWVQRFHPIFYEDAFSYDDWIQLRDEVWSEWVRIVGHIPPARWQGRLFGRRIEFHRIALQHLSREYLRHRRLVRYLDRVGSGGARIADSMAIRHIRACAMRLNLDVDGKVQIARGPWLWDVLVVWGRNLGWVGYVVMQAWGALRSGSERGSVEILHEGLSPSESGAGPHELSFLWITERAVCPPGRSLFVVATPPKRQAPEILLRHALLRGLGWRTALRAAMQGARLFVRGLLHALRLEEAMLAEFSLRSIAPYLLVQQRGIRTYLTTKAAIFPEHPAVAVFNAIGVRTVLWTYSANMSLFNVRYRSAERHFYTAHMEAAECWLWSEHHRELWRQGEILPSRGQFRLIGPAMMGDATPCLMSPPVARRRYFGLTDRADHFRTVAVFDITPVIRKGERARVLGPLVITLEWVDAFYQHLARLLETFSDIRLIVKTKRQEHPNKQKPPALRALVAPQSDWVRSGRVIYPDPDINPYIPIGAADLTIGLPFTSPVLAGLHFGRRGIYHDPLGIAVQHHYHELDEMISHGYADLEQKVRYWLYRCGDQAFQTFLDRPEVRRFLGPRVGADPAEEFGKALWGERFTLPQPDAQRLEGAVPVEVCP